MGTKKFEVGFEKATEIAPSYIYISPNEHYEGHYNVGILYVESTSGNINSPQGKTNSFGLEQNLIKTEHEAINWAIAWLTEKSQSTVTIAQVE
jgi:hypothetical protein